MIFDGDVFLFGLANQEFMSKCIAKEGYLTIT